MLIVEDDYLVATEAEAGLIEAGFSVVGVAQSAGQAVALAETERPDLVVMDIRLIGPRDGIEAAVEIYRRFGIRCLFATAHQNQGVRARAAPAEPLGWLPKPYAVEALVAEVRRAMRALGG